MDKTPKIVIHKTKLWLCIAKWTDRNDWKVVQPQALWVEYCKTDQELAEKYYIVKVEDIETFIEHNERRNH